MQLEKSHMSQNTMSYIGSGEEEERQEQNKEIRISYSLEACDSAKPETFELTSKIIRINHYLVTVDQPLVYKHLNRVCNRK